MKPLFIAFYNYNTSKILVITKIRTSGKTRIHNSESGRKYIVRNAGNIEIDSVVYLHNDDLKHIEDIQTNTIEAVYTSRQLILEIFGDFNPQ